MSTDDLLSSKGSPNQDGFVEIYGSLIDHMDHNPKKSSRTVLGADPLTGKEFLYPLTDILTNYGHLAIRISNLTLNLKRCFRAYI